MLIWCLLPALLQMLTMFGDEFVFHRKRGLPPWERWGHPLDTLSTAACYAWLVARPPSAPHALSIYIAACAFSCLLITKDELVHARVCEPAEQWLHSLLFVLHPVVFLGFGWIWYHGLSPLVLRIELGLTLGLAAFQVIYWSPRWRRAPRTRS
jgi:hypothetical protein